MLRSLQRLHAIAAERGDGLRPEFLNMRAEENLPVLLPVRYASLLRAFGHVSIFVPDKSQVEAIHTAPPDRAERVLDTALHLFEHATSHGESDD